MVKFSIITATYNSQETLKRTMESVLNQSYAPFEYLIIDGASKDDTLDIVKSFKDRFDEKGINLRVYSEPDNGIYDAMNKGIDKAEGDIVGIINSDDWYEENALSIVADAYESEGFGLFFADLRMHMVNGQSFIKKARLRNYATSRDWNHPTTFIAKEIYNSYKYRTKTIHDDYDLILRLKKAGVKTVIRNEVVANFTMNGVSHTRSIKDAMKRCAIKYSIYRDNSYSPLYFIECFVQEMGKLIIG